MKHPAIIVLSPEEMPLARRIAMATGAAVHGLSPRVCGGSDTAQDKHRAKESLTKHEEGSRHDSSVREYGDRLDLDLDVKREASGLDAGPRGVV